MKKFKINNYIGTFIVLSLTAYPAISIGFGSILFALLAGVYYLPKLLIDCITKKPIQITFINFSLCFIVYGAIITTHHVISQTQKQHAIKTSLAIEEYFKQQGEYPKSLDEIDHQQTINNFKVYYGNVKGKPYLSYRSYWIPFSAYFYNFAEKKWDYLS